MAQVLTANPHNPHDRQYFSSSPLLHSSHSHSPLFLDLASDQSINPPSDTSSSFTNRPSNCPLRPSHSQPSLLHRTSSFSSLPSGPLSLNTYIPEDDEDEDDNDNEVDDDGLSFPKYFASHSPSHSSCRNRTETSLYALEDDIDPKSNAPTPDVTTPLDDNDAAINPVADDIDMRQEPSRQVDYLSHDWKEEDIWSSWRHIVARRKVYGERSRLENASWRTWTKQKYGLKTVSPETLNWLKDYDVTWLYGPLQEAPRQRRGSEPTSQLSKNTSFLNKKPILKKRSVSEEMLQKSISSSSLIKQAAAAVQAQRSFTSRVQGRPITRLRRCASDFDGTTTYTGSTSAAEISSTLPSSASSGIVSPESCGRKRIRFDNNVEQCIAVDFKEGEEGEVTPEWMHACSDEESDDDLPTIKAKSRLRPSRTSSSRTSISSESKGIVKLPSTTLKFHHDEADFYGPAISQLSGPLRSPGLSPSASQETLKPSKQSSRFLLDEQDDEEIDWEPSGAFGGLRSDSVPGISRPDTFSGKSEDDDAHWPKNGMRRTSSGMLMPFEEGQDDSMVASGFIGRVVDTVNTARDICYVLYNVGWRK